MHVCVNRKMFIRWEKCLGVRKIWEKLLDTLVFLGVVYFEQETSCIHICVNRKIVFW